MRWPRVVGALSLAAIVGASWSCAHTLRGANPELGVDLPADHAAHDDAQTEWWHFHGHVHDEQGRRYDWFLAFIKQHTDEDSVLLLPVHWFVDPFRVAYFVLTERATGKVHIREKHAYPDVWAASEGNSRMDLRHNSWRAVMSSDGSVTLRARSLDAKMNLRLQALKAPALLGKSGYLHFPPESSHYYYSIPRMSAEGTVEIDGEMRKVKGLGWLKHEWGFLYTDKVKGWVWFGVQMSSGQELEIGLVFDHRWNMMDGSFAVVEERDGTVTPIDIRAMEVREKGDIWRSPRTDTVYPTSWLLEIPGRGSLLLDATVEGQEMVVFPANLWAGGLKVEGVFDDLPVTGDCFAEVVGLDDPFGRSLFRSGRPHEWVMIDKTKGGKTISQWRQSRPKTRKQSARTPKAEVAPKPEEPAPQKAPEVASAPTPEVVDALKPDEPAPREAPEKADVPKPEKPAPRKAQTVARAPRRESPVDALYRLRCAPCHGGRGRGDGPAAAALMPKPRDFSRAEWQRGISDAQVKTAILRGGAAIGRSPVMPGNPDLAGRSTLVRALIRKIRKFAEGP